MALFESLPHAVQVHVFVHLPLDTRLRCVEVCRGWRRALQDCKAWTHLAVPDCQRSGVNPYHLLRAALARTGGQLETLDVSNLEAYEGFLEHALFEGGTALAPAQPHLRELRLGSVDFQGLSELLHVISAAPQGRQQQKLLSGAVMVSQWLKAPPPSRPQSV